MEASTVGRPAQNFRQWGWEANEWRLCHTFSETLLAQAARVGKFVLSGGRVGMWHRAARHGCRRVGSPSPRSSATPPAAWRARAQTEVGAGSTPPKIVRRLGEGRAVGALRARHQCLASSAWTPVPAPGHPSAVAGDQRGQLGVLAAA